MSDESEQASQESLYSYKKVCNWDCDDVSNWMKGISESVARHIPQFLAHSITGNDLLKLSRQQLEYLKVSQIGHQELILEAIELLASVDNSRSRQSTISLSSSLSKKTSQLVKAFATLKRAKKDEYQSALLECMEKTTAVLQSSKYLIGWLDRFPTELIDNYRVFREDLLQSSLTLAATLEPDELDIAKMTSACSTILRLTGGMMSPESFSKPDPVTLVTITLVPDEQKGLGFSIQKTRRGALVISQVQEGSPADRCGQITEGVELIQINDQNTVYWDVKNVVKNLKASGHEVALTLRVSTTRISDSSAEGSSQEALCDQPQYSPPTVPLHKPKPAHLHLALERVSSSPALIGDSPRVEPRLRPQPHPLTPQVPVKNGWSDSVEQLSQEDVSYARQKSHSLSDALSPESREQLEVTSPEAPIKPVIAYRTEIIGGVVHRVPIQPVDDMQSSNTSATPKTSKKNNSLRKKHNKQRSSSLSDRPTKHSIGTTLTTPTSPLASTPLTSPFDLNEGGDVDQSKAIFSNLTDVVVEGKVTKQVTVSSGPESSRISRDGVLRTSGKKTNPELLVPCFQLKDPDFEGWVSKLGGSGFTPKNWRRRWFVLKAGKLYYYKTSFDISALGIVELSGYTIEQALELKKKNAFKASRNGARTYYFFTDTAEEMLRWMDALTKASVIADDAATIVSAGTKQSLDSNDDKSTLSD